MSRSTLITIGVIIVVVVAAVVLTTTGNDEGGDNEAATSSVGFVPSLINGVHQFDDVEEVHAIAGQADVATACHELETETNVNGNVATVSFTATADEDQMCAQVITPREFRTDFAAAEDVIIQATYNGQPVELNLQKVEGDQDINDLDAYSKG